MAHARRFRFGAELQRPFDGLTWAQSAQRIEDLGFSTLFVPDHFHQGFGPIAAMATAAAVTTRLNVAPLVLAADFRHPAVLARELASIDVLSEGRLEVGIGAGYNPLDYSRSGITMDPPKIRVDRMIEHVRVLKNLLSQTSTDFRGEHYAIRDLDGTPKPHTPGGPPVIVAGGGRRILEFAAREGNIVGVNVSTNPGTLGDGRPASIDQKLQWMREAAGDRIKDLELNAWVAIASVTDRVEESAERAIGRIGHTSEDVLDSPLTLIGTEAQIAERLHMRRERWGYSYFTIQAGAVDAFAPIVAAMTGT